MSWQLKTFEELTNEQLYNIIKERLNIFVVEQDCPYPELDDIDQHCFHLFTEEEGEIKAYCRILEAGLKYEEASIGRVIVKEKYRRNGLATELLNNAIDFTKNGLNETKIKIQAQDYLKEFYGSFGFQPVSEVYLEDGIPHVDMILNGVVSNEAAKA
ncbi:GNAT family N-acetyltransferase [Anaerobacillus arseniciselenatis]|uniref:GNAT family N-acetyltransferase n=1 Tax=Anaerobacillus arseniciselenatis TaxID=85682 RepID=A0A1S2LU08_9BACI|nr:GNAT family N-acetyltransferase [Anaerobacillus arseniciselenatis]OIJ15633.1 GNAT family N-acetyltransferase [Anaerobacillus arseniciselenatis]